MFSPAFGSSYFASWYGGGEKLNRYTSSGQVFRPGALTAAHRTLPLGTKLELTKGNKHVVVVVNDRGPAAWTGRNLDISRGAAKALGVSGLANLEGHVVHSPLVSHKVLTKSEHHRGVRGVSPRGYLSLFNLGW